MCIFKIEEHEKALKILVYTLQDHSAAIDYCLNNSNDSSKQRKQLFHTLFAIYMNPTYRYLNIIKITSQTSNFYTN